MKDPNHELESAISMRKYQSSFSSELHFQALEKIVNKYNDGLISVKVANKKIDSINDIRKKFTDIKSIRYVPISIQKLEALYRACSEST